MRADDRNVARLLKTTRHEQSRLGDPEKAIHIEHGLPVYSVVPVKRARTSRLRTCWAMLFLVMFALLRVAFVTLEFADTSLSFLRSSTADTSQACPQVPPITPSVHSELLKEIEAELKLKEYRTSAIESLSGAIRIP